MLHLDQLGPYRILAPLGKGGMGAVYRAVDQDSGQPAAIKVLNPQLAMSEGFRERFEGEIATLKTLRHEAIVRLYGYGEEQGVLFYAMELVEGTSLDGELKAGRRFNWRETVDIAIQVCRALKHAHDHGVVHRDIKPANILIDKDDKVKIADFGIARLFGGSQLTMAGGVLGTADYMSPEQADGRGVTDRCDQYSLGCVMYTLLAGRPPFKARSLPEMLQLQRFAEPDPVRRYNPDVPAQLEAAIRQLLQKEPEKRFPNVLVLSRHLEAMRLALSRPSSDGFELKDDAAPPLPHVSSELALTQADASSPSPGSAPTPAEASVSLVLATGGPEAATLDSLASAPPRPAPVVSDSTNHFTTVDQSRRSTSTDNGNSWTQSLAPALALAVLVGTLGAIGWYVTRPATADSLYRQVTEAVERRGMEGLREVESQVLEFQRRYGDDHRSSELADFAEWLSLDRLDRRFAAMARTRSASRDLLPSERLYLEAVQLSATQPGAAWTRLNDLQAAFVSDVTVAEDGTAVDEEELEQQRRVGACMALVDRRLAALDAQFAAESARELPQLEARLKAIEASAADDRPAAVAACRALVTLYSDRPWADAIVKRATELAERLSAAGGDSDSEQ